MFVIPTQKVGFTHRVVAMLVAFATILWSIGVYSVAQAANLINVSDLLTDSGPSVTSGHTIKFTTPSALSSAAVEIQFPVAVGQFDFGSLVTGDVTASDGTVTSVAAGKITLSGVTVATSTEITVTVAPGKITNPTAIGSYELAITAGTDSGKTRVAIVDYVTVKAKVDTVFDFVVKGLATSTTVNSTTTTGSTTPTTLDFGTISSGNVYTLGQELNVTTNAIHGFVVTVQQDGNLRSSTGADIDGFVDGNYQNTPIKWASPTKDILDEKTWGHWGLTSDDGDLDDFASSSEFTVSGGDNWVAASTTPRQIFSHNGPADGTTQNKGLVKVGYSVEISPFQEAADDYTTTLMYVATPTF